MDIKKKQLIRYSIITIIVITITIWITVPRVIASHTIKTLNEHSTFDFELIQELTEKDYANYHIVDGFGVFTIYSDTYPAHDDDFDMYEYSQSHTFSMYDITAYPDHISGGKFITSLMSTDPGHSLFGYQLKDIVDKEEFIETLEDYHYSVEEISDKRFQFERSKVRIVVTIDDGVFESVTIYIRVTNRFMMVF